MQAAVWYGPGEMKVEKVADPQCGGEDVLLRVLCCNICGSDVRTYTSGSSSIPEGTVLGHEFVGQVLKSPKNSEYKPGQLVTAAQDIPCTKCWYCTNGMEHICENKLEFGKHFQGAFAEQMVIPEIALRQGWVKKVPDKMSINAASLVEPLSSCVHTRSVTEFKTGEKVLIIGSGPIGCIHGELAKEFGAQSVIIADLSQPRLDIAKKFGFTEYINPGTTNLSETITINYPFGVDKVISANPSPKALAEAIGLVRKGGTVVAFGGLPKDNFIVEADGNRIHYDEVVLTGSYAYSRAENDLAFKYVETGVISSEKYITSVYPLAEIEKGMKEAQRAEGMKVQILINEPEGL